MVRFTSSRYVLKNWETILNSALDKPLLETAEVIGVKIIIQGDAVQQVGYRLFLAQQALLSGIEHFYATNINKDEVHILLNGDERKVDRFYDIVKKEKPDGVSTRDIRKEPYEGDASIPPITTYLSLLSVDQLIKGRDGLDILGNKIDNVGKNIEQLPDKIIDSFVKRLSGSQQ